MINCLRFHYSRQAKTSDMPVQGQRLFQDGTPMVLRVSRPRWRGLKLALMAVAGFIALVPLPSFGQNIQHTQNKPDLGLRSDLRVDPSTLGMSIQIPLANYRGRAGTSVPLVLYYNSKVWRIEFEDYINGNLSNCFNPPSNEVGLECYTTTRALYAEKSIAGWTFSSPMPTIESLGERYDLNGRPIVDPNKGVYIARLTVRFPDGSTHEMRKSDSVLSGADPVTGTYYAVDSSLLKFVGTSPGTGALYLPNGSRFDFANWSATRWVDRNGNVLTNQLDTLGRQVGNPNFHNGWAHVENHSITGVGGASLNYSFDLRELGSTGVLEPDMITGLVPALHRIGDMDKFGNNVYSPALFNSVSGSRVIDPHTFNPIVLHRITLPNGTSYTFTYNQYGEIAKVVYPTGGYERYRYGFVPPLAPISDPYSQANRGVVERRVSANGTGNDEVVWQYDSLGTSVTSLSPDQTRTVRFLHTGYTFGTVVFGFDDPRAGMVYEERVYAPQSQGGAMLRRILTKWDYTGPTPGGQATAKRDPRVSRRTEIVLDTSSNALAKTTIYQHDADLNVIRTEEYDFVQLDQPAAQTYAIDSISPGTRLRSSEATFLVNDSAIDESTRAAYRARHLIGLPTSSRVKDGSENIVAQSRLSYDEGAYPVLDYGAVTGWIDPATNVRGNVTTTGSWLNTTGTYLQTHAQYDQCGSVRNTWDAKGNQSQIEYSSTYSFAYPTLGTSADPDGAGPRPALTTATEYDVSTGLTSAAVDANGQRTTLAYDDPLNRLTQVTQPNGARIRYSYFDSPNDLYVKVLTDQDPTRSIETRTYFDGLGRATRSFFYDATASTPWIAKDAYYDILGRISKVSNPYRASGPSGTLPAICSECTTTVYDFLDRVLSVTTPDNAQLASSYGGSTIGRLGLTVLVTDQGGKARKTVTDALGRLVEVYEDPGGLSYQTSYKYDALDNLTLVTQGNQTRSFDYSSLGSLMSVSNPESGVISYEYDENGNLTKKIDPRMVPNTATHRMITYSYDGLNRVTTRTFNDGTPNVSYSYDAANVAFSKGRLTAVSSSVSSYSYDEYDALGRVKRATQTTDGQAYPMSYAYNHAGAMTSVTYPSGRVVNTDYDEAGRVAGVKNNATGAYYAGAASTDAVNRVQYTTTGAIQAMKLGNGLWEHTNFNSRLQPIQIGLGSASTNSSVLQLDYDYGTTNNNGNLRSHTIIVPTVSGVTGFTATQTYTYDSLNRLATAQENNGSSWKQNFDYDRYGNRKLIAGTTLPAALTPANNPTIAPNNNRIDASVIGQTNIIYDDAGNLTLEVSGHTYQYDAENKMVSYDGGATSNGGASYSYDGNGRRVKKVLGGSQQVTSVFVYDIMGHLVAEYSSSGAINGGTSYITSDMLGSPRVITGTTQEVKGRHDYLPFGDELIAGTGGRTPQQKYGADNLRQQFTQKERDVETGLDYFLARYYSSTQGRFTGVDPFNIALETQKAAELNPEKARALFNAYLSQPQQWNRYSYAINNPLLYVDPDGEAIQLSNDKDERERQLQALREMVGSNAGAYLYANQGSDGNWYVGIYDQNPNGDTRSFEQVNEVAGELGAIVRDKEIAVLEFVPRGTRVTDDSGDWARIVEARRGAYRESPAATGYFNGVLKIKMLDWSKHSLGYLPGELMSDRKDNWLTASVMVGHELGHARARMTGYRDRRGNSDAIKGSLRLEDKVRKLQNPNGPRRERH